MTTGAMTRRKKLILEQEHKERRRNKNRKKNRYTKPTGGARPRIKNRKQEKRNTAEVEKNIYIIFKKGQVVTTGTARTGIQYKHTE